MNKTLLLKLFAMILLSFSAALVRGQDYNAFVNDNHFGVGQLGLQPAAVANGLFRADVNIFSSSNSITNNLVRIKGSGMFNLWKLGGDRDWWGQYTTMGNPDGKVKSGMLNDEITGPSFMIPIGPKQGFGFTFKVRNLVNVDNFDEPLARSAYSSWEEQQYWNQWIHNSNARVTHSIFSEYDFTYGREIVDLGEHYFKGGVTVKLIQGISGMYFYAQNLDLYLSKRSPNIPSDPETMDADSASWNSDLVQFGVSDNWGHYNDFNDWVYKPKFGFTAKPTIGLDLGFVYEWRPDHYKFTYDMDGKTNLLRNDIARYKLKVGVSILDIGRVKYTKSYNSADFMAAFTPGYGQNVNPDDVQTYWMLMDQVKFNTPRWADMSDTIFNRYPVNQGENASTFKNADNVEEFKVALPTTFSLQVDYNVIDELFVNFTGFFAMHKGTDVVSKSHYLTAFSITPRYESRWIGASLPVSYNQFKQMMVGLGLHLGFLWVGSDNILGLLGIKDSYGANFQFAVKIPIMYDKPPHDLDKDGVSDHYDKCPSIPGIWELRGCPDRDGDGVPDTEDLCPDDPGPKDLNGCPDQDGDGIIDKLDNCPTEPGLKAFNGCPDTDGDGVMDKVDRCPDTPGLATLEGCPDRDGDGVADDQDKCPDVAGLPSLNGCPFLDTDGDGVKDSDDKCPTVAGPVENNGCPYPDTDKDGVLDKDDKCPLTPGDPKNDGCPL